MEAVPYDSLWLLMMSYDILRHNNSYDMAVIENSTAIQIGLRYYLRLLMISYDSLRSLMISYDEMTKIVNTNAHISLRQTLTI